MEQHNFSDILGELQANFLDAIEAGRRHAASLDRLRALISPEIEAMRSPRAGLAFSDYAVLVRERAAAIYGGSGEMRPAAGLSLGELRRELARKPDVKRLNGLRRRFAMGCHPDRVAPANRSAATREMQLANDLIDRALRELS